MGHGRPAAEGPVRETFDLTEAAQPPDRSLALACQGLPADVTLPDRVQRLTDSALELYTGLARPRGTYLEVSKEQFAAIYPGEGCNSERTPLEVIYPRAAALALFVVTLGDAVCQMIRELFDANEPALAYALDSIASERADTAAGLIGTRFLEGLLSARRVDADARTLAYSPGYCGWHVTGQRRLFAAIDAEPIGVSLNDSCLMQPLKSVSGVLVAGDSGIHDFDNDFDFCDACTTYACRERIATVRRR